MLPDALELWDFKRNDVTEIRYDFPHAARQTDAQGRNEGCQGGAVPGSYTPIFRLQDVKKTDPIALDVLELWGIKRRDVKENPTIFQVPSEKWTRKIGKKRPRTAPPRWRKVPSLAYKTEKKWIR